MDDDDDDGVTAAYVSDDMLVRVAAAHSAVTMKLVMRWVKSAIRSRVSWMTNLGVSDASNHGRQYH